MNEPPKINDRVVSISYRPYDEDAFNAIVEMKRIAKKTGKSFSFLAINAIKEYLVTLDNVSENKEVK